MKKHKLDAELSQEVYEYFKEHIQVKSCYNNIFNILTLSNKTFREGKWKVAYGYTEVMPLVYCRHCFILDEYGTVIDPTIYTQSEPPLQREYYVMYVFDDADEYLNAIESDNLMPALDRFLREQDKQAQMWAIKNNMIFVG